MALIKNLIKLHSKNNVIPYKLKNLFSIDENINESNKDDVKNKNLKSGTCYNQLHCGVC